MFRFLSILQKNLVWSIPISMILGLAFGYFFDAGPLKQFIIPVTFVMVYPMMATLNVKSIFKGKDAKLQATTQTINFILIPLIAFFIGKLFFSGGPEKYGLWALGLFLIGVLPTSGMTISWTGFAKGNKEAAIKMVVFGLIIGALAAPIYTKVFMGATIEVHMLHMFKQIALFVFVPLIAGLVTQSILKKKYGETYWNQHLKTKFPPFSALGVMLIAFVAMSLKAKSIIANPGDILTILAPLAAFYFVSYALLSIVGRIFFPRGDAIAMVYGVVMRDLSIALAIAMTAFGKQGITIALLIALAYVIQIQSAAWYVKLVDRIFEQGVKKTDTEVSAKVAIHERIKDTSRKVAREIPQCPLNDNNVEIRIGNPVEQILSTVRKGNFDLIIMGTHGHGKLGQSIIGSVAGDVIRRCSRPVMVVKLPEHGDELKKEWQDSSQSENGTNKRAA